MLSNQGHAHPDLRYDREEYLKHLDPLNLICTSRVLEFIFWLYVPFPPPTPKQYQLILDLRDPKNSSTNIKIKSMAI